MKPYSLDLRQKVVDAYSNGEGSFRGLAKRFKVSLSFIQRLLKRYREEGTIAPKTLGGGPTPQLEPHTEQIHLLLEQCNDLTLEQLGQKLAQETGVKVSLSTLCRFLQKHKLTRKKNNTSTQGRNRRSPNSKSRILATNPRDRGKKLSLSR